MAANKHFALLATLMLAIMGAGNYGCGGGSSNTPPASLPDVSVSPSVSTVQAGATQNVIATVTNDDSN
jgi:hypothetical protein